MKSFAIKIFAQDNEITLGWIVSAGKKFLLVGIDNLSEVLKKLLFSNLFKQFILILSVNSVI